MTEAQFAELRDYTDGYPLDKGYAPPKSLVNRGWIVRVVDNFYRITPAGIEAMRKMGANV